MRNAWGKRIDPTKRIATAHPATFRNLLSESIFNAPAVICFQFLGAMPRSALGADEPRASFVFTARGVAHYPKTIATAGADRFTFVAVSFAIFVGQLGTGSAPGTCGVASTLTPTMVNSRQQPRGCAYIQKMRTKCQPRESRFFNAGQN